MALQIAIEDPATGAAINYHRITALTIDLISMVTVAVIRGYISEAARRAGKNHLTLDQVQIPGVPAAGENALAWAYSRLSAEVAAPVCDGPHPVQPAAPVAWVGAEVV